MKSLSRCFNQMCKQKYQPLGFSKNKTVFARIEGEIIQSFILKRSQYVPTCTVEFAILPLCMPTPIYLEGGGYELDKFIVEQYLRYSGWAFDPHSNESIERCIECVSEAIDLYLLPLFDKCTNCEKTFHEVMELEELFERNRLNVLHLMGESDAAMPFHERSLFDPRKYYMALKSHNYSYAKRYLENQVDYHDRKLKEFDAPGAPKQPDGLKVRFLADRAQYSEQLERLYSGDFAFFDNLLDSNESQTLNWITTRYPNIRKY